MCRVSGPVAAAAVASYAPARRATAVNPVESLRAEYGARAVLSAKCEVPSEVGSGEVASDCRIGQIVDRAAELAGSHHFALPTSHSTWHFALST